MYKGQLDEDRLRQLRTDAIANAVAILLGWLFILIAMGALLGWPGSLLVVGFWLAVPGRYVRP